METYNNLISILILLSISSFLFSCGSRPSDFDSPAKSDNPLPPCPDSPNCIRITKTVPFSIDSTWEIILNAVKAMKPYDIELEPDEYRIKAVFLVVFFRDDMTMQLEEIDADSTYLHLRSASRIGYTDFGVNTQRVSRFLSEVERKSSK